MAINSTTLRRLAELSLAPEQMAGVLTIIAEMAEVEEERKEKQRNRKRRSRDNDVTVAGQVCDAGVTTPLKERSPTPPKENNPSEPNGSDSFSAREFDEFWKLWPNKAAKKAARRAFASARKRETLETILDGVRRYVRTKPPDRDWMHAATFLNGERWNDDPTPSQDRRPRNSRPHDAIFRALAEQAQAGNGLDQRQAGPDVGHGADNAGTGGDPGPVVELEAAAFRRAV